MKYKALQEATALEVFGSFTENYNVYGELIDYFKKANFKIDEDNRISQTNTNFNFWLYDHVTSEINLLDVDGKSKLVFGISLGDVSILRNHNIKTLKNLFTEYKKGLYLEDLKIVSIGQNIKSIDRLQIIECKKITDMSTIQKVEYMHIDACKNFTKMKNLPKVIDELHAYNMTLNTSKNDKIQISNLQLGKVIGIKNFLYLPQNMKILNIEGENSIESFIGVDSLEELIKIRMTNLNSYTNIIATLLCKSLQSLNIFSPDDQVKIIGKYMKIPLSTRSDHVMDCAVELIDAGYPEAAEL